MVKIVPFEDKYLDEMSRLFSLVYSDENGVYPPDLARKRLAEDLISGRDYSFVALDENGELNGGIICKKNWAEAGWELYVDTVQVYPEHQKQEIGKMLMSAAIAKAGEDGASAAGFPVDVNKSYRAKWYESLGFISLPNWVTYWAKIEDLKI